MMFFMGGKWESWERIEANSGAEHHSPETLYLLSQALRSQRDLGDPMLKAPVLWGKLSARGSDAFAKKRTKWKRDEHKMERKNRQSKKSRNFGVRRICIGTVVPGWASPSYVTSLNLRFVVYKMRW